MSSRDYLAAGVTVLLLGIFVTISSVIVALPQEEAGYDVALYNFREGESFTIAPLSPSLDTAEVDISVESRNIFLLTGDPEILGEVDNDMYTNTVIDAPTGEWVAIEGSFITVTIHSETALKVVSQRGIYYHLAILMIIFGVIVIFWLIVVGNIYI